jgi:hypothetical protein
MKISSMLLFVYSVLSLYQENPHKAEKETLSIKYHQTQSCGLIPMLAVPGAPCFLRLSLYLS